MEVIRKDVTPSGIKIQFEKWDEGEYGCQIGAYPIARNASAYGMVRAGEKFRLTIAANQYMGYSDDDLKQDYDSLVSGDKKLEDLARHFWNGDKDEWYLGMIAPGTDEWNQAYIKYGVIHKPI